ncbi:uncharacterized protein LOC110236761 [Exaiptasia diaphana]|uniref:Uncharacterized protein n=1 Tax=Exaiptasia diaphana TaxID=2652724 RepID=A0A913YGJ9_EXADI|nr:uncharacterized protein LOC110236761 [Exaiptasia diaphana]
MQASCTLLLCVVVFMTCFQVSFGTNCEAKAINECVVQGYIKGFSAVNTTLDDIGLHCTLDRKLLQCTERALNACGKTPTLLALGRAVLSYIVFDRNLGVCRKRGYWTMYQLLKTDAPFEDKTNWNYKILTLLHYSQYSDCAKKINENCLKAFVHKMKVLPDLCTNIPFKYNCIKPTTDCPAKILHDILNVFPDEANKVLAGLCQPQDSG